MQPSNDSAACLGAVASAAPVPISLYFSVNVIALPVLPDSLSLSASFSFFILSVCVSCLYQSARGSGRPSSHPSSRRAREVLY